MSYRFLLKITIHMANNFSFNVVILIFIFHLLKSDACMQTIPVTDILQTCLVRRTPFGTFLPAVGNRVPDGGTATLTCNTASRLDGTITTATCSSGVLSSTSACIPCPDDTWIYDSTTNRCFKAFAAKPIAGGVCTKDAPCVDVGAPYELPSSLAYTLNLQALLDAAAIGIATNVQPVDEAVFYVGISDPLVNDQYQLDDGTPLPYSTILPYFTPTNPSDDATNVFKVMTARVYLDGLGLDDDTCTSGPLLDYGSICQIQLS